MEYTGQLVTGDFGDNTMTFKIDGEMTLQAGKYKIVQVEVGNSVKNNVDLADVGGSAVNVDDLIKKMNKIRNDEAFKGVLSFDYPNEILEVIDALEKLK